MAFLSPEEIESQAPDGRRGLVNDLDLRDHPAVRAWTKLRPKHPDPLSVEIVQELPDLPRKTQVYRVHGIGPRGMAVIAKRSRRKKARTELTVYRDVLPRLPVATARYYGSVDEPEGDLCWLFLEDVSGEKYSASNDAHLALASRWLALLHSSSAPFATEVELPACKPAHFLDLLRRAQALIAECLGRPGVDSADAEVLEALLSHGEFLAAHWREVEAMCHGMPTSLMHGDFMAKNLMVRTEPPKAGLFPFDWEGAAWAIPAIDLVYVDTGAYYAAVRDAWPDVERSAIESVATAGRIFWTVKGIRWSMAKLAAGSVVDPMTKIRRYERRIANLLHATTWGG